MHLKNKKIVCSLLLCAAYLYNHKLAAMNEYKNFGQLPRIYKHYAKIKLHEHVDLGNVDGIKEMISFGVPIDTQEEVAGNTALHTAVHSEKPLFVKTLLELKANVNAINNNKETPLHLAAYNADTNLMKRLIDHGADNTMKNAKGRTPLEEFEHHQHSIAIINSLSHSTISVALKHNYSKSNHEETKAYLLTITFINYLLAILLYS